MMAHSYKFSVMRAIPDARKGEIINVGIVVFHKDTIDVRLAPSLNKLLALDGSIDVTEIRELPLALGQWTARFDSVDEKYEAVKHFGVITLSEMGVFQLLPREKYEDAVSRLMKLLVLPKPRDMTPALGSNRITTNLKDLFERKDILGKSAEDIHNHLVIHKFPIDADDNLYADFALKNGAYWITETADFRAKSNGALDNMRVAGLASVKINMAKKRFRGTKVNAFIVYASQNDSEIHGQINLMSEYADELVNLGNKKEMASYTQKILNVAGANRQLS